MYIESREQAKLREPEILRNIPECLEMSAGQDFAMNMGRRV